jgi:photosystem II stability/assembly factor-like uncharacterized protein
MRLRFPSFVIVLLAIALSGCARKVERAHSPWEPVALTTDADFRDIWFADERHGWTVGGGYDIQGGIIGRTRDGGATWSYATGFVGRWPGVSSFAFTAVQFFDSLSGCTIGSGGQIFLTDDGGENWRNVRAGAGEGLSDLQFIDRYDGWAVGGAGVLATTDGGENWNWVVRSQSENGYLGGTAIWFLDRSTGFMAGYPYVMKTNDGGATWTKLTLPLAAGEHPRLFDVTFVDPQHGWVVGESATILATTDGGWTWVRQTQGIPTPTPRPLFIVHRQHGVDTLDLEGPPEGLFLTTVRFLDPMHGWTVGFFPGGGRSVVLRTEDGGATWKAEAEASGQELRGLFVTAGGRGWTIGDRVREGGQVLLRRAPAESTGATVSIRSDRATDSNARSASG